MQMERHEGVHGSNIQLQAQGTTMAPHLDPQEGCGPESMGGTGLLTCLTHACGCACFCRHVCPHRSHAHACGAYRPFLVPDVVCWRGRLVCLDQTTSGPQAETWAAASGSLESTVAEWADPYHDIQIHAEHGLAQGACIRMRSVAERADARRTQIAACVVGAPETLFFVRVAKLGKVLQANSIIWLQLRRCETGAGVPETTCFAPLL